jgi:hypothetical protein
MAVMMYEKRTNTFINLYPSLGNRIEVESVSQAKRSAQVGKITDKDGELLELWVNSCYDR